MRNRKPKLTQFFTPTSTKAAAAEKKSVKAKEQNLDELVNLAFQDDKSALPAFTEQYHQLTHEERQAVDAKLMMRVFEACELRDSQPQAIARYKELEKQAATAELSLKQLDKSITELIAQYQSALNEEAKINKDFSALEKKYETRLKQALVGPMLRHQELDGRHYSLVEETKKARARVMKLQKAIDDAFHIVGYARTFTLSEHAAELTFKDLTGIPRTVDGDYIYEYFPMTVAKEFSKFLNTVPEQRDHLLARQQMDAAKRNAI